MKSIIVNGITFALSCMTVFAASVSDVTARQRYPWNGMVDVEFTITGESGVKYDTSFLAKDLVGGTNLPMKTVHKSDGSSAMLTNALAAGTYKWAWNTAADLPKGFSCERVKVEINAIRKDPLYMVVDLSGGPNATKYPVNYLDDVPSGGWTDEYKTTKLVLRRIEKGSISEINSGIGNAVSSITIDKPYYIGVFEVTRAQYAQMKGGSGDARPQAQGISYDTLRGTSAGALYPGSTAVDATSVIGILRTKTGLTTLDLPTEAQWEYACRAGTTSDYNNGGSTEADLATLGRYAGNRWEGRGGFSGGATTVGSYAPNRWGLYDMHGNVFEWCLEWYSQGRYRAVRGGGYLFYADHCRSGYRGGDVPSNGGSDYTGGYFYGFRLCCSAGL